MLMLNIIYYLLDSKIENNEMKQRDINFNIKIKDFRLSSYVDCIFCMFFYII